MNECKAERALQSMRDAFAAGGDDDDRPETFWSLQGHWTRTQTNDQDVVDFDDGSQLVSVDNEPYVVTPPPATTITCLNCSWPNRPETAFCAYCGLPKDHVLPARGG